MLVLSSPSGAGKSTIARNLLESDSRFSLSISVTTRKRRPSEIDGVHYHFIDQPTFEHMRDTGALLEWAEVHGNSYGTPRAAAERAMQEGSDMLFDIDYQGALQLQEQAKADIVSIFILPPSMSELKTRLLRRAEDSGETITVRLKNARVEIERWRDYDYVVVNDDLDRAFSAVRSIINAERLRRDRRPGLFDFTANLLAEGRRSQLLKSDVSGLRPGRSQGRTNSGIVSVSARRVGSIPTPRQEPLAAERLEALAQHLAPLAEGGRGDALESFQGCRFGRRPRRQLDDGGGHLGRRHERLARDVEQDLGVRAPAGEDAETAVMSRTRRGDDALGHLASGTSGSGSTTPAASAAPRSSREAAACRHCREGWRPP